MQIIYEPSGKAREYAPLALNIYMVCRHQCLYCYAPSAAHRSRNRFFSYPDPKTNVLERVTVDARKLAESGDTREILMTFIGDPYEPMESQLRLTRGCIEILIDHGLTFTVLTKGGTRAARDFDLMRHYDRCSFGTSLVFRTNTVMRQWEFGTATVQDRASAIQQAREAGIRTWISLEPVISPLEALEVIRFLGKLVDHWKIGKINHNKAAEEKHDWFKFYHDAKGLLDSMGASYYFKDSLTKLVEVNHEGSNLYPETGVSRWAMSSK